MNTVTLNGIISNIRESHNINEIVYNKADLLVNRGNGKEDLITLEFKKFANNYKAGDEVAIKGNIRSYSRSLENGKNKVDIFVFTYFDKPDSDLNNHVKLDGRICKISDMITLPDGKQKIQFILANNILIEKSNKKLNSYIPCVAFGKDAKMLSEKGVSTFITLDGYLHSRCYKKFYDRGEVEICLAHEVVVTNLDI